MKRSGIRNTPPKPAKQVLYTPRARTPTITVWPVQVPPPPEAQPETSTPSGRAHMGRVKALRCVLCARLGLVQEGVTDVHHLRHGQGMAQRASDWLTAALCHGRCHQGPRGIHGDRSLLRQAKATEMDLLAWTLADIYGDGGPKSSHVAALFSPRSPRRPEDDEAFDAMDRDAPW